MTHRRRRWWQFWLPRVARRSWRDDFNAGYRGPRLFIEGDHKPLISREEVDRRLSKLRHL